MPDNDKYKTKTNDLINENYTDTIFTEEGPSPKRLSITSALYSKSAMQAYLGDRMFSIGALAFSRHLGL